MTDHCHLCHGAGEITDHVSSVSSMSGHAEITTAPCPHCQPDDMPQNVRLDLINDDIMHLTDRLQPGVTVASDDAAHLRRLRTLWADERAWRLGL